jgi:hypothetical protein
MDTATSEFLKALSEDDGTIQPERLAKRCASVGSSSLSPSGSPRTP